MCRFDPETGVPITPAAKAQCVARWKAEESTDELNTSSTGRALSTSTSTGSASSAGSYTDDTQELVRVDYQELERATNGFNKSTHLIGEGGSCLVYEAEVYGHPAAIKVFNEEEGREEWDSKQLNAEIHHLSKFRHPHITRLLAVCFDGPQRCLVLERMEGGALDTRLRNTKLPVLPWRDRARVRPLRQR